jgi:hypothetical protein
MLPGVFEMTPAKLYAALMPIANLPTAPIMDVRAQEAASVNTNRSRRGVPRGDAASGLSNGGKEFLQEQFVVEYRDILLLLQLNTVVDFARERYGESLAGRVLRALLERGALDEKSVSELVMAPQREARVILYKLLSDGIVTLQEVPRRPDRHPQFTAYLFRADFPRVLTEMTEWCHRTLVNIRRRLRLEYARFIAAGKEAGAGTLRPPPLLAAAASSGSSLSFLGTGDQNHNAGTHDAMLGPDQSAQLYPVGPGASSNSSGANSISGSASVRAHTMAENVLNLMEEGVQRLLCAIHRCDETLLLVKDLRIK